MKVTLHIDSPDGPRSVPLEDELTIGRTDLAKLVLDDAGLSRVNTTFFIDGEEVFVADENSLNGTFLNGERISGKARQLSDGDELRIGSYTTIRVVIGEESGVRRSTAAAYTPEAQEPQTKAFPGNAVEPGPAFSDEGEESEGPPIVLIASVAMALLIVLFGGILVYFVVIDDGSDPVPDGTPPPVSSSSVIPRRVIDPLGNEDDQDLADLIASWETAEEELKAEDVADISVDSADAEEKELNVSAALLADRQRKAFEPRPGETGIRPAGLNVPPELSIGFRNQTKKLDEMKKRGYRQPMDFAELAEKRLSRDLIEMPMAQESFYLDVGGSAQNTPFTSFRFQDGRRLIEDILVGSPKYGILSRLASNFAGQQYDLNNPAHRKQMRMRLLRMFNKRAKDVLREIAGAYHQRFNRPLRVTSLTRSMDYQILLNSNNANSFKVTGEGSLPPHTSGCAFDLARKHMPVEEQNFLMQKLAEMERGRKLDALIEYGANACFHIFIYDDGVPPR